jgi:hypothetical protein
MAGMMLYLWREACGGSAMVETNRERKKRIRLQKCTSAARNGAGNSPKLDYSATRRHNKRMLPDNGPSPEQIAALRAIPGEKRLKLIGRLYWSARKLKAAGLRHQHPDWTEEQIAEKVREIFLHART